MDIVKIKQDGRSCIENHLDVIESAREELEAGEDKRGRVVKNTIVNEYELSYIVEFLQDKDACPSELQEGLNQVRDQNQQLKSEFPGDFDQQCTEELEDLVNQFPMIVCHIFKLEPMSEEVRQSLSQRDSIEVLLGYLSEKDTPEGIRDQVEVLDEVMRCTCRFYRSDEFAALSSQISRPYYPDRFWWRHPDQVLSEQ